MTAGFFDPDLRVETWFDLDLVPEAWFDIDLIQSDTGADTTAPVPSVSPSKTRISRVTGFDTTVLTITADEPVIEYQIRRVSAGAQAITDGQLIEQNTMTATTSFSPDVTDDELVAAIGSATDGNYLIKVFVKDVAGNWSI
jgi:hypothetical protein